MKKLFAVLTMCLLLGQISIACAAPDVDVQSTYGNIVKIRGNTVTVEGTGYVDRITLTSVDEGYIREGQTGAELELSDLSVGIPVTVYYTSAMTRSNPPQTKSLAIITGNSPDTAKYFQVGFAEHFSTETKIFDINKNQSVTIKNNIFHYPSYITRGQELLLWYPPTTTSVPTHATATKAMNIYHDKIDIIVNLQAGVASVNDKEIPLTKEIHNIPYTLYLPVRQVSEALGFDVDWNSTEQTIIIKNVVFPVTLTVGSTTYIRDNEVITLANAPIIYNGVTLAPIAFFSRVLGATIDVNNN